MKRNILYSAAIFAFTSLLCLQVNAQVAINATGSQPNDCAMLDVSSTSKGLLIPRMSSEQRDAISNPTSGLLIYQTSDESFYYWEGGIWYKLGSQWVNNGTSIYYPSNVVVGGSDGDASAALDVQSTTGGVLVPRMTENEKNSISTPATGLLIYQIDGDVGFQFYNGTAWSGVGGIKTINVTEPLTYAEGTTPTIGLSNLVVKYGGTGATTFATNGIIYGNGTNSLSSNTTFVRNASNQIGIGTSSPHSTLTVNGSFAYGANSKTGTYTLGATDNVIFANSSNAFDITLPSASSITGRVYTIKNINTGAVTVKGTIDGTADRTLAQYKYITVISNGTAWFIISDNL